MGSNGPSPGLREVAGRDDAGHRGDRFGEAASVPVVLVEALDHARVAVLQRHEAGGRDDPDLAHPAADHLARAAGAEDEVLRADDDRADRAGEALAEAERERVGRAGEVARGLAERDRGVEEAGAIDVQRDAVLVGEIGHPARVCQVERLAHRERVGVLERDHAGQRAVEVAVLERAPDAVEAERAVGLFRDRVDGRPDERGVPARLVEHDVRVRAGDRLVAAPQVGELRDEVALRATRDEQSGLFAEQLGSAFLERVERRVFAVDVVTELGLGHRAAHLRRRLGDRVAPEVDQVGHRGEYRTGRRGRSLRRSVRMRACTATIDV